MQLTKNLKANTLNDILYLANLVQGQIDHVYAHWSAGHYGQAYEDYHICINYDGKIYLMTDWLAEKKSHTWQRNSRAVGIALLCCYGARAKDGYNCDFGPEPPTLTQLDSLAQVTAILARGLRLPIDASIMMTHCEAAVLDGYGPGSGDPETRWDMWYVPDFNRRDYQYYRTLGGSCWRGKAKEYFEQFRLGI